MLTKVSFYITAIVCLITAFVIKRVYFKEKNKNTDTNSIQGIKWFALAIFSWGAGAFINIILTSVFNISTKCRV